MDYECAPERDRDSDFVPLAPLEDNERLIAAIRHLQGEVAGLEGRNARYRHGLRTYGRHKWGCESWVKCTCGFFDLLNELDPIEAPTQEAGQSNE